MTLVQNVGCTYDQRKSVSFHHSPLSLCSALVGMKEKLLVRTEKPCDLMDFKNFHSSQFVRQEVPIARSFHDYLKKLYGAPLKNVI